MRIPTATTQGQGLRLNLTPLIDVIFNLIIFFLAAAHFARSEPSEPVDLPIANPRADASESPRRLTITVAPGPRFFVAGREQPREVVEAMISTEAADEQAASLELRIRADRTIPFGQIEPLMIAAAQAGVTDVKFPVIPQENVEP